MKRYEGLLRPLSRPAPWPSRWICVATEGRPVEVVRRKRVRQTGLSRWYAVVMEMRGERCVQIARHQGDLPFSLWELLGVAAARSGLTWVISPRALLDWTLLGLWERLLLGDIAIANDDPARRRVAPDRGLQRQSGMLMVGDPPSAASLLIGPDRRRITWTCAKNYGWDFPAAYESAQEQCDALAKTTGEASEALARHRLGGWCPTVGAMALRAWRSQHLEECLYVDENTKTANLISEGNIGGRIACREKGTQFYRAYHVDIRGGYSSIGASNNLPTGLRRYRDCRGAKTLPLGTAPAHAIARVAITDGRGRYPKRTPEGIVYPKGSFETVLCGPELQDAIETGVVSNVHEYAEYRMGSPLAAFQRACYAMRCAAESAGASQVAALAKALGVTLIGKLHSYSEMWEECVPDYNDPIYGSWLGPDGRGGQTEYRAVAGQVSRKRRAGLSATAIPAMPLWVWSYGRLRLLRCLEVAGWDQVIYAHTDGLVTTATGWERLQRAGLIRDNEWGQLRYVAGPVECEVIGPHCIRIGDELIQPGAPRSQRGREFAENGYWFRRPMNAKDGLWNEGVFEEEYRDAND